MTTKLQQLFPQKNAYAGATNTNHAGAPAFVRSLEEQTVQVLMTGTLEGTYYCSADTLAAEAIDTLTKMASQNPLFLAKAIVYARNDGYLRLAPIIGLLVLSKADPHLFKVIFKDVILQPGDLQDFVTLVRSKSVRSTGKSIRSAVGDWMNSITDYHVVKYGAPQKKPGKGSPTNLRDILRLAHPRPADDARAALFSYIVKRIKGDAIPADLLFQLPAKVKAYEDFKFLTQTPDLAKKNEKAALELVAENDLPYEVVLARLSSPSAWKALAAKAPFMNMLRNLNNYEKNGVFKDKELKAKIIGRLQDVTQIERSKQFPFRFLAAYNAFQGDQDVRETLAKAVELSVMNIPDLGRTLVAPDESGSMSSPVSDRSDITMKQVGNLFAAALWKKSSGGFMVPFSNAAYPVGYESGGQSDRFRGHEIYDRNGRSVTKKINKGDSIVTIAETLGQIDGGTDLSAPLEWAMTRDFDTGIFITDSESWIDLLHSGHGVLDKIRQFRSRNPKAQFFFIQLVPNAYVQAPQGEPGVHFIYGWSDQVLKYIASAVSGGADQVARIKASQLPETVRPEHKPERVEGLRPGKLVTVSGAPRVVRAKKKVAKKTSAIKKNVKRRR